MTLQTPDSGSTCDLSRTCYILKKRTKASTEDSGPNQDEVKLQQQCPVTFVLQDPIDALNRELLINYSSQCAWGLGPCFPNPLPAKTDDPEPRTSSTTIPLSCPVTKEPRLRSTQRRFPPRQHPTSVAQIGLKRRLEQAWARFRYLRIKGCDDQPPSFRRSLPFSLLRRVHYCCRHLVLVLVLEARHQSLVFAVVPVPPPDHPRLSIELRYRPKGWVFIWRSDSHVSRQVQLPSPIQDWYWWKHCSNWVMCVECRFEQTRERSEKSRRVTEPQVDESTRQVCDVASYSVFHDQRANAITYIKGCGVALTQKLSRRQWNKIKIRGK